MIYLPGLDKNACARSEKNHPARVFIIIDEIEQNHNLDENIGNNLAVGVRVGSLAASNSIRSIPSYIGKTMAEWQGNGPGRR